MRDLRILKSTPARLGYTFPAEWEPHAATWLSWPRPEGISFPQKYEPVPGNMAAIIRQITPREHVEINIPSEDYEPLVVQQLQEAGCPLDNIHFHPIPTNENWCRDHGPSFLVRKTGRRRQLAVVNWGFNAWGRKYPKYKEDDAVPTRIAEELGLPLFRPGIVMEGGSVDFNGQGTILTTESCLLNNNRNPGLSRHDIERILCGYYGQRHVVWLSRGIVGDDTDGHVDDLARFIGPRTIVAAVEEDPHDVNYLALQDNLALLREARDQDGRPFEIITVPMPSPVVHKSQRLPATYVNFYFVNGALLVPTYRDKARDGQAMRILQSHLKDRQVIGVDCVGVIWGLGAIHCLTQQQPLLRDIISPR